MLSFLKEFQSKLDIKITCSQETEPLGTAGPLALARDMLVDGSGDPFFVLNSDVISEYPFAELIKFHKSHGGEATIMVTKVPPNPLPLPTYTHTPNTLLFIIQRDDTIDNINNCYFKNKKVDKNR